MSVCVCVCARARARDREDLHMLALDNLYTESQADVFIDSIS